MATILQASQPDDEHWMRLALAQARQAAEQGEVPVGAVLVRDGKLLAEAHNQSIGLNDPSAHAEITVLRKAGASEGNYRLPDTSLYVTLEPCAMCVGAMVHARIARLVFAACEPKAGCIVSQPALLDSGHFNHRFECTAGVLESECSAILSAFFSARRRAK